MAVQKRTTKTGKTRWVARYRDKTGREHSKSFDTQREAKQYLADQRVALTRGTWANPTLEKTAIGTLVDEWVQSSSEVSRPFRMSLMRNLGDLADQPVGTLTPADIRAWVATLQAGRPWKDGSPLGVSSVSSALANLKAVLERAVDDGLIPKNPARTVTASRPTTRVTWHDLPTRDLIDRLIRYARTGYGQRKRGKKLSWFQAHPDLAVMIRVSAATGLRPGEVAGLSWRNVDFEKRQILVMEQAMRTGAGTRPLKTGDKGIRALSVDDETLAAINELPRVDERVFHTRWGGVPMTAEKYSQALRRLCLVVGVDPVTPHAFRHFHATELLSAGVPVKAVQRRLGHSSARVTLDVYAHFVPGGDDVAVDVIAGVLSGAGSVRDRRGDLRVVGG